MNRTYCLLAASFVVLVTAASASAATRDEQSKACRGDAMHFCAVDIPNEGKIIACMKRHLDDLSPACRAMFQNGKKNNDQAASQ